MAEINNELAELCGVILGDGHLHTTENRITITGSLEELDYYKNHLVFLLIKNFGILPRIVKYKNKNAYRLILEDKNSFKFLINELSLFRGKKTKISIPKPILNNLSLLRSFIKGLFDTDGYLKFSKQKRKINYYPRIRFSFYKTPLALKLSYVFNKLDLSFNFGTDKRNGILCYEISGSENLKKWMYVIGSSNNKHLTKYLIWKKLGFCPPRISLKQRQELLKNI